VQFPWRWLEILDLAFAFFVAAAISQIQRLRWAWFAGVIVFVAISAAATAMVLDGWWDSADVPTIADAIHTGRGYEGTDEYTPLGGDRYELPGDPDDTERLQSVSAVPAERIAEFDSDSGAIAPATGVDLKISRWSPERRELAADTATDVTLAVKLLNYSAWEVRVDGKEVRAGSAPDTGQMLVDLQPGSHRVAIRFRRTWDRTAGGAISILSALGLLAWVRVSRKRKDDELAG